MEEDIKNINEMLEASKIAGIYEGNKYFKAIENLIARNKELEENNKLLIQEKFREVANKNEYIKEMYIPKSKIKEKIEELEGKGIFDSVIVLQELLEES